LDRSARAEAGSGMPVAVTQDRFTRGLAAWEMQTQLFR
jgi:hypothetical protein